VPLPHQSSALGKGTAKQSKAEQSKAEQSGARAGSLGTREIMVVSENILPTGW